MSLSDTSDTSQIRRWASRQLADYDACHPGTLFAEPLVLEASQAYALQSAVAELRRRRGERIIGYKVGCTSPTIRAQLGIDHCVTGRLYDNNDARVPSMHAKPGRKGTRHRAHRRRAQRLGRGHGGRQQRCDGRHGSRGVWHARTGIGCGLRRCLLAKARMKEG
jgi:hypothetical protein